MRTISFIRVEFFYVEMALIEETFRDIIVRMLHLVLVGAVRSTRSSIFYLVALYRESVSVCAVKCIRLTDWI